MGAIPLLLLLSTQLAWAQTSGDSAVIAAMKQTDPAVADISVLYRRAVSPGSDLVIVTGAHPHVEGRNAFSEQSIGIFLQERGGRRAVSTLAVSAGCRDCSPRVERATATDTVISWTGEKGARYADQKFVYDIVRKSLLDRSSYGPASMRAAVPVEGGAIFIGQDPKGPIAVEYKPDSGTAFEVLDRSAATRWSQRVPPEDGELPAFGPAGSFGLRREAGEQFIVERRDGQTVRYPLPQSTYAAFAKARPARVRDGYTAAASQMNESVGPWKPEGNRLWFGKTFYDGEGSTGVGGFGYFDTSGRKYRLFSPPEIADWSVSAIDLNAESVWLGLVRRGEWGATSGGILRFDRRSQTVQRFAVPDIVNQFAGIDDGVAMATEHGIAVVRRGQLHRYFVDAAGNGQLQIVEAER